MFQVTSWIFRFHLTVYIRNLKTRNEPSERIAINNQNFENMTYEEIIKEVENGAKFTVNFEKRTCRVNGKDVTPQWKKLPERMITNAAILYSVENLYQAYKHSVPSERSESHRRSYFKALPEKSLSDEDMLYGERREVARCKLELHILRHLLWGQLVWEEEWGSWFWQSPKDKDLVLLRSWIEPEKD